MVDRLGTKQREVYQFILQYLEWHGCAPTMREIAEKLNFGSTNTVDYHLKGLERKGYIRRRGNLARAIEIVDRGPDGAGPQAARMVSLPIRGLIAAGEPIQPLDDHDRWCDVSMTMAGAPGAYALRVRGTSMIDEHICDGDLVIIEPRATAANGEIVVALLEDGVTLKTFFREGKQVRLQPANKTMKPILVTADQDFAIQGVLRGVIRQIF
ncbi:MAG TPA: transcriptional repressor LexA [Thermomicrobiales bacterium]|jgi:repressor LexA